MRPRMVKRVQRRAWSLASAITVLFVGISGCGAVKQDIHRYYRQMARNYQEAEAKAKFEAITLEADSRHQLQAGNVHKYNRTCKELARIRNWQDRCAHQRQRFEKAASMLEPGQAPKGAASPASSTGVSSQPVLLPSPELSAGQPAS